MRILILAALASAIPSPALPAEESLRLEPSSPWNVDYDDDSCALKREFGPPTSRALLELRQFSPGAAFSMLIARDQRNFRLRPSVVRFLPEPKPRKIEKALYLDDGRGLKAVKWYDSFVPERPSVEPVKKDKDKDKDKAAPKMRESDVSGIEIGGAFDPTVVLMTGEMHKPMEAMRACLDELLTHWGIDAAAHRTLSRLAEADEQESWARKIQEYYPIEMLRQDKSGEVRVRMMVGPDGKPTECHVQIKSQDPSFEQTACREMMKSARFKPALDAAGTPIASYYVTRITYMIF